MRLNPKPRRLLLSDAAFAFSIWCATSTSTFAQDEPQQSSSFYGQINRAILSYDDGVSGDVYSFVDGAKSPSHLGYTAESDLENGWHLTGRAEIGLHWKETNRINQTDPSDSGYEFDAESLRKLELIFAHAQTGTFSIGQGSMASNDAASQDLSLTNVVSGAAVKDVAGGMYLRKADGTLSNIRIKDRFRTLGFSRHFRLRYDTVDHNGISLALAVGKEVINTDDGRYYADAAVRYEKTIGDLQYRGAAALRWAGGNPDTNYRSEEVTFSTSGSVLHKPSRFNGTLSFGHQNNLGDYIYAKIGRRWYNLVPYGWTAASFDYYWTKSRLLSTETGTSVGVSVVQQFKAQKFDVYATVRQYKYDDKDNDYLDSLAVLTGLRWRF